MIMTRRMSGIIRMVTKVWRLGGACRLALCAFSLAHLSACGTLVHVVDEMGHPIEGAEVIVHYPSTNLVGARTDNRGFARVADAWFCRPFFLVEPQSIAIAKGDIWVHATWPPPSEVVLSREAWLRPGHMLQR